jgi:hypothetical protein
MINDSLTYIKNYLSNTLEKSEQTKGREVELSTLDRNGQPVNGDVLITLVRIEEERSTPSLDFYQYTKDEKGNKIGVASANPPIILNLYVLITAQAEPYETSLTLISKVISAFHAKRFFDKQEINIDGIESLALDMFSPTYEQNNSLWQTLGVKMMPAVMYKLRAIVFATDISEPIGIILPKTDENEGGITLITYTDADKAEHQKDDDDDDEKKEEREKRSKKIH